MAFLDIFSKKKVEQKVKEKIKIEVDSREKNSLLPSELVALGFDVEFKQLAVGDYIVKGIAIERKTISDFKSSIIDKRIITQLKELRQYKQCILLIEGIGRDMYEGGIHENALRGFLLSVALEFNVPVIFTHDEKDSAKYISVLAKKEKGENSLRASKIFLTEKEQLQFILEGFPHVGPAKAKKLLEKFGSLRGVFNASEEDLGEILGNRAGEFRRLLEAKG